MLATSHTKKLTKELARFEGQLNFSAFGKLVLYVRTEVKDDSVKYEFYSRVESVFISLLSNDVKIILSDLNAKFGK